MPLNGNKKEQKKMSPEIALVTGFEPFGGYDPNPSWQAAVCLDNEKAGGFSIRSVKLPVDFEGATVAVLEKKRLFRPSVIISLGLRFLLKGMVIERRAGKCGPASTRNRPGGLEYFDITIPYERVLERWRKAKIPSAESVDAGGYVCEWVAWLIYGMENLQAGFFHLPEPDILKPEVAALAVKLALEEIGAAREP